MGMWYHLFIAQLLFYHRGKSTYKATLETKVKMELTPKLVFLMRLLSKRGIFPIFKYWFRKILGNSKELAMLLEKERTFMCYLSFSSYRSIYLRITKRGKEIKHKVNSMYEFMGQSNVKSNS